MRRKHIVGATRFLVGVMAGILAWAAEDRAVAQAPAAEFSRLNEANAVAWGQLVLNNVDVEFPNKMSLIYVDETRVKTPRENFPAFYGCFDWHSSVHGHWVLVRLLKSKPNMDSADAIRSVLNRHLNAGNIKQEAAFFARDEHKSFERMYGWSWLLKLASELDGWDDPDAKVWRENLRPLEMVILKRVKEYLPLLTYPIRTGQHTDTGFALGQLYDYARAMENRELEQQVVEAAKRFYMDDRAYPVSYEPSGHDFFSSCWNEADLMRRILPQDEFVTWLEGFVPRAKTQLQDGTVAPVQVSDVTDGKLVHLAGLNLSRAWCLRAIANALPEDHQLQKPLGDSALAHLRAGVAYVNSGHYAGDHWLATFALYAITEN